MKKDINIALSQARLRCENGLQFVRQYYCQAISLSPSGKFSTTQTDTHIQREKEREREKKTFLAADNEAADAWCCICNAFFHAQGYNSGLKDS